MTGLVYMSAFMEGAMNLRVCGWRASAMVVTMLSARPCEILASVLAVQGAMMNASAARASWMCCESWCSI